MTREERRDRLMVEYDLTEGEARLVVATAGKRDGKARKLASALHNREGLASSESDK